MSAPADTGASAAPAATAPITAARTGHVALNVSDLARSLTFYRDVFGFDVIAESGDPDHRYAFLGRDSVLVLTLWQQSSGDFAPGAPGLHHLAFDVPTPQDVETAVERLRALGVPLIYDEVLPHMPGLESGGIFCTDPDGLRIEICTASGLGDREPLTHGQPSCGFF
ncbi:VOC family protein [Millisia brevis]|uniref:VOC family protein n=1 Tax=Millisia brevis TaxID=264148 RepID=UPI0009FD9FE6|nr:VOC family protein [Millisia brevis]